jgi:hypothetical protein
MGAGGGRRGGGDEEGDGKEWREREGEKGRGNGTWEERSCSKSSREGGWVGRVSRKPWSMPPAKSSQNEAHLGHLALAVSSEKRHVVDFILDHEVLLLALKVLEGQAVLEVRQGDWGEHLWTAASRLTQGRWHGWGLTWDLDQ